MAARRSAYKGEKEAETPLEAAGGSWLQQDAAARAARQQQGATERYYRRAAEIDEARKDPRREALEVVLDADQSARDEVRDQLVPEADPIGRERILGRSDLIKVNYLHFALRAARAVGRIVVRDSYGFPEGYGTGFLVGEGMLLTNNHVLQSEAEAANSVLELDYEEDESFHPRQVQTYRLDPADLFVTDADRDYTLVGVARTSDRAKDLTEYGALRLIEQSGKAAVGECVSIIQHPRGNTKHIAIRENRVEWLSDDWIHYSTDTEPGSSGSPVFNDQWYVVALHHSGVAKRDGRGRILRRDGKPWRQGVDDPGEIEWVANEGLRISRLFASLRTASDAEHPGAKKALGKLEAVGPQVEGPPVVGLSVGAGAADGEMLVAELPLEHYVTAQGFDTAFLGNGHVVALPRLSDSKRSDLASLADGSHELKYTHFSVVMSRSRRLAYYTACNVDGRHLKRPERSDRWYFDPRLPRALQAGPELYRNNPLDRGHLVRRLDPCWGAEPTANRAGEDTFHFTNCAPQHSKLNQTLWLELEDYVLDSVDNADARVCVFTGPVFRPDDRTYRGEYLLPADYWKVVAFVNRDGALRATAYLRTQRVMIDRLGEDEFFDDDYKTYQVPLRTVETLTDLSFGIPDAADPMAASVTGLEGAAARPARWIDAVDKIAL